MWKYFLQVSKVVDPSVGELFLFWLFFLFFLCFIFLTVFFLTFSFLFHKDSYIFINEDRRRTDGVHGGGILTLAPKVITTHFSEFCPIKDSLSLFLTV